MKVSALLWVSVFCLHLCFGTYATHARRQDAGNIQLQITNNEQQATAHSKEKATATATANINKHTQQRPPHRGAPFFVLVFVVCRWGYCMIMNINPVGF
jgi:hypothetical protein